MKTVRIRRHAVAMVLVLAAITMGQAEAGLIVVSGDTGIANPLVGDRTSVDAGNQRFFTNILGNATKVLVQATDSAGILGKPASDTNTFYNSLAGVTSTLSADPITSNSLAGVGLFVSATPFRAFTASEIAVLSNFSSLGGSILLMGEGAGVLNANNDNLNALLSGLGSTLRIEGAMLDSGPRNALPYQILANPLTSGVSTFNYGFTSVVSGGTSLFLTSNRSTFVATEVLPNSVPEPASLAMVSLGIISLASLARRRAF